MIEQDQKKSILSRELGFKESLALVVGTIIGTGIFLKAAIMTQLLGSPQMVMLAWVVAGFLSLAGALTYAELGSLFPRAGGEYVYLKETYGNGVSFLYGWMRFWIGSPGSIAAYAVGASAFLMPLLGSDFSSQKTTLAIGFIILFTVINCLAVHFGGSVQVFFTVLKVVLIGSLILGVLLFSGGSFQSFSSSIELTQASAFGAALLAALWAFDGWNNLGMASGEVKSPQKNIPKALVVGLFLCLGIYCLVNAVYFFALPVGEVASANSRTFPQALPVATKAAETFLGESAVKILSLAFVVSALGAMHGSILTSARVPFAMANAKEFPQLLAYVHPRTHAPVVAVLVQGGIASTLAASGTFDQLTDYVVFSSWVFYALNGAAVIILRSRLKNVERAFSVPLYPLIPVLFVTLSILLLINTLVTSPRESLMGLAIIGAGFPVYWFFYSEKRVKV
jgi:APA family basic amino acid/polyamine antiporter